MNMIDHFEKIISLAKKKGLNDTFIETAREHLDAACAFLNINQVQAVLFALIFEHFGEDAVSVKKIAETLKCTKMQLLRYMDDFDALRKIKVIRAAKPPRFLRDDNFQNFTVPLEVIKAIRNNTPYQCKKYDNLSPEDFFVCAEKLLESVENDEIETTELVEEINYLFSRNTSINFVQKRSEYDLGEGSVIILLVFCCALLHRDEELIKADKLMNNLNNIIGLSETLHIRHRFETREHKLFVNELVEFDCRDGLADTDYFRLSQKAKEEFLADVDLKEKAKRRGRNFLTVEKIAEKKLFYGEKIKSRIRELTVLLHEDNFSNIKKRLVESKMRTGFTCIFSGPPGTGKTETAYQIARDTGRDIMLVNIAETKSMWFGGSEKLIKGIFDRYRGIVKNGGLAPILLFNEADAILGKRRELSETRSGPDQTENAIQNIILQEMEDLNGILIATTNMTANLDKAFERRFLYKIEFEKPDLTSKKLMWQSLIPALSDEEAIRLASKFDFSGGQIENIARKSTVSFILNGSVPDISVLETFCKEELLEKHAAVVGFCA